MRVEQASDMTLTYRYYADGAKERIFRPSEIWHLRGLASNGYMGISPIEQAREAIGLSLATERFGASLFGNGAQHRGVLTHPKLLSMQARKNLKDSFDEQSRGIGKAQETVVLEEGVTWTKVGMNADEGQFLETRKYQRSEIASLYRVPPHMIGDLERATFSNIEHQSLEFVTHTMMPWVIRWEQRVNANLLTDEERRYTFFKFNLGGLLRGDTRSRYEAYKSGILTGWLSRNEARVLEDLNPVDGLDEFLTPMNMADGKDEGADDANVADAVTPKKG